MTTRRLSKRQIKEDTLMTGAFRAFDYVQERSRIFLVGAAAVVVLVLGFVFVRQGQRSAEARAGAAYAQANLDYWRGNYAASLSQAEDLLDRSAGTRSGKMAILLVADCQYMTNRFEDALAAYQRYLRAAKGMDPILTRAAKTGVAASLEQLGRYRDAAQGYLDLEKEVESGEEKMGQALNAARCFHLVKAYDEEIAVYERILEDRKGEQGSAIERVKARLEEARMLRTPPAP